MNNYPDGLHSSDYYHMEGCVSNPCTRCGRTDYHELGWRGALARWSKEWGISEEETERRFLEKYVNESPDGADYCG